MKYIYIYSLLSVLLLAAACNKKDDFAGTIEVFDAPVLQETTPAQIRIKQMYDTYHVLFRPEFGLIDYSWNWENRVAQTAANVSGLRYTPAAPNYVIPVIDSLEKWVFKVFPPEFSKKYMPLNILMTDTMENKQTSGSTIVHRLYEGYITTNYILVSYVSPLFEAQKSRRLLRESWLSLFVEKMLVRLPAPTQFTAVSTTGYAKASFTNAEDVAALYAILKKGRTKQTTGTATSAWNRTLATQDFGDFVAFIVYTPEAEKQTVYAKNASILVKVNLVKAYFKENFNIELPYIPVQP